MPDGEPGEICVSGPLVEGLLEHAGGDGGGVQGRLAAHRRHRPRGRDGFLIVDRVKDMISPAVSTCSRVRSRTSSAPIPAVAQVAWSACPTKVGRGRERGVVLRADADRDDAAIETMTVEIQAAVKERKGGAVAQAGGGGRRAAADRAG